MQVVINYRNYQTGESNTIEKCAEKKLRPLSKLGAEQVELLVEKEGSGLTVVTARAFVGGRTIASKVFAKNISENVFELLGKVADKLISQTTTQKGVKISSDRRQKRREAQRGVKAVSEEETKKEIKVGVEEFTR